MLCGSMAQEQSVTIESVNDARNFIFNLKNNYSLDILKINFVRLYSCGIRKGMENINIM